MKKLLLFCGLLFTAEIFAQHIHPVGATDKPASVHGMLIMGKNKIYASHLPLFHDGPHNYQIILELELDSSSLKKFVLDQEQHPEFTTYTIAPEEFILPEMVNNPRTFRATLFRGHFERGGEQVAEGILINIKQVIYFKKLSPGDPKSVTTDFIVFGNDKEQFMAHRITNKPDFEQVVEVSADQDILTTSTRGGLQKFRLITLNKRSNNPVGVSGNDVSSLADNKKLVLLKQIYLEFDDLK